MTAAVLFDFYGTLAVENTWGRPSLVQLAAEAGFDIADQARLLFTADRFDGVDHREHSACRDDYLAWERGHRIDLLGRCGVPDEVAARLVHAAEEATGEHLMEAYPETLEVLDELRRRGVKTAICSNWDWDLDQAIASAGLTGTVDVTVTSAQAGARKPHPHIYDHTLELVGADPAGTLFVGDSFGPDVVGPVEHGMRAALVWRDDPEFRARRPEPPGDLPVGASVIEDLRGVLDLL